MPISTSRLDGRSTHFPCSRTHYRWSTTIESGGSNAATVLNNLGDLYRALGRYGEAESSIDKALELRAAMLGEQDLDYAQALSNAALLRKDQGRLSDAEKLARQALSIFKGKLDKPHPNVAVGETNLAALRLAEGHLADALDGYQRARSTFG